MKFFISKGTQWFSIRRKSYKLLIHSFTRFYCGLVSRCRRARAQPDGGRGGDVGVVATPALFVGDLICALLVTAFYAHLPKPRRSTWLKMIKIASTVLWYYYLPNPCRMKFLVAPLEEDNFPMASCYLDHRAGSALAPNFYQTSFD